MKLHRYVDHQRLHIVTKDVISLSISVLLLFRHYISHKITFGAPSSGGVLCSACGAFISACNLYLIGHISNSFYRRVMHEEDVRPLNEKSHAYHFSITYNGCDFCLLAPPVILALPKCLFKG